MHYLLSLQCILAAWSKNVFFFFRRIILFSVFVSVSLCLDLWKCYSQSQDFFIPVSLSLWCSHFYPLLFLCSSPLSLALPSHSHALFCSVSGLWCFSHTRHITVTFSLCLSHPYTHVHFTLFPPPFLASEAPSTSVSLSPPLSSFAFPLKSSEPESELMPLQSAFILTQREKERRGMYLDSAGAQLSLLLCEMIHLWLIALLGTLSKQTTSGCGIFHPNWLEL